MGGVTLLEEVEQSIYRAELAALKAEAEMLLRYDAFRPSTFVRLQKRLRRAASDLQYAHGIARLAKEQLQARQDEPAPSPKDESSQADGTTAAPPKTKRKSSKRTR